MSHPSSQFLPNPARFFDKRGVVGRYTIPVQVGSPPQHLNLILDTGSSVLVIDIGWTYWSAWIILLLFTTSVRTFARPSSFVHTCLRTDWS